ncbi:hypothetical protein SM124_23310 [Bacillus sp. 31A1R]|uniref:Uncharacterized protein n=1 Tax=Robertmurraya mangrovi TaxID=3098077 RepID=A0ABU5J598_9BACI|nr:hypothetical protein [Bacillus sp. 31A1R]MDZ5474598.1 hypothetical protein [Bacillus sp. 31A1R]
MDKKKQNEEFLKPDPLLKMHLDSYQVDIPDFPMKKNRFSRLIGYLASPTNNPFEGYVNLSGSLVVLSVSPILIGLVLMGIQILRVSL